MPSLQNFKECELEQVPLQTSTPSQSISRLCTLLKYVHEHFFQAKASLSGKGGVQLTRFQIQQVDKPHVSVNGE